MHPRMLEMDEAQDYPACFPAGSLVLTQRGYQPIETVSIDDKVFTHERRWRRVNSTAVRIKDTVKVVGHGHPGMLVSDNHRFYAMREQSTKVMSANLSADGHSLLTPVRGFEGPDWVPAAQMESAWWSTPTRFPKVQAPPSPRKVGGRRAGLLWSERSPDTLWLLGLFLADGCIGFRDGEPRSVIYTVHIDEVDEVLRRMSNANLTPAQSRILGGSPKCVGITINSPSFATWLYLQAGHGAYNKQVPAWVYGLRTEWRRAVFEGAIFGDGYWDNDERYQEGRWKFSTVGKAQAAAIRTLAATLGYVVSWYWVQADEVRTIRGRDFAMRDGGWWQVVGGVAGQAFDHNLLRYQRVRSVVEVEKDAVLYDLGVDDDESFVVEGVVVHNSGWVELTETLRYGDETSRWRAHGVSRGVRDHYYKLTQSPDWFTHRYTACHRPDWTAEEREAKAEFYGSRDHPDYRRNILGLHGDAMSALFVLHRLMAAVDSNVDSDYNANEYYHVRLNDEFVRDMGIPIENHLDFPGSHKKYRRIWGGMDVGLTNHPTEILIWGEEIASGSRGKGEPQTFTRLKCLARIHLERISAPDQAKVLERICEFYKPAAIGMDKTGLGLPIYQYAIDPNKASSYLNKAIRGYNFSEKIIVSFEQPDSTLEEWELAAEDKKDRALYANVLEYSSDQLRLLVDQGRIKLPWDIDMLKEFQGQAYYTVRSSTNPYGKKEFNKGKFHALDAARMAILSYVQHDMEKLLHEKETADVVPLMWIENPFEDTGYTDMVSF